MSRRRIGSIRERRPGVYRVEVSHGRDPVTGERLRMSQDVHGTDIDAERALAQMLLDIGKMPSAKGMTVAQFIDDIYIPALPARVRRKTRTGYESKLKTHVVPKLGHIKLAKLEPYTLDRWRDELATNMSGRSALNVYRVLSTALNRAVRWRLLSANPLLAVDPPKASVRPLETLTADEVVEYLEAFVGHAIEALVAVQIATGLRPCEVTGLKWSDIDLANSVLTIRRGLHEHKSETWFEPPKSDRSNREVSLPPWAVETLKRLRGFGPLAQGDGIEKHMRPTEVARLYRRQVKAKKLRYLPMRDIRHTHATLLLEAGVDVVVVSRRLGHSTVAITDLYYLRPKRSADVAAAEAFGKLLALPGDNSAVATDGDKSTTVNE